MRPVIPPARRIALIVASVPELTSRTCSTGATRAMISSASSTSAGVGAPNESPLPAAERTASTTAGCACPRIIGPHELTRSTSRLPSASVSQQPLAEVMNRGVPPTALNALTGEFTPPGIAERARSNSCSEATVAVVIGVLPTAAVLQPRARRGGRGSAARVGEELRAPRQEHQRGPGERRDHDQGHHDPP